MTAGGANSVLYYGAKTTSAMDFRLIVSAESELLEYKVRLADSPPDTVVFETERVMRGTVAEVSGPIDHSDLHAMFVGQHRESLLGNWTVNPPVNVGWMTNPVVREMVGLLRSCRPYHINDTSSTALIRRYGYIEDNRVLRSDAANLAAVLHRIRILTPKIYERIVRIIRQINPRFGDFVLEPQTLNPNQILLYWREKGQETLFGPHQLSDGTLRAMALVTLLLQPEAELPALLVVDEPELGLHPYALNVIVSLFKKHRITAR
jgi:predicted ATPase